jgi:glycosyltransferase involved in cell wall biosynthesis
MANARVNPMKLDVVLLTKNSLKPCLSECVESIYRNVPVNRLLVVDGGSTDGTLELLRKYPGVKIIDDLHGTRASARQKGIDAVETEWHIHVDSDVILCEDWFRKAWENVADNVGAVWGVAVPNEKHYYNATYAMSKLYRISVKDLMVKQMRSERCMMHDTLIRTSTVTDIKIPANLHIYEDDYIGRHIIQKGFRFLKVTEPYCLHNVTPVERTQGYVTTGYLLKVYHYGRLSQILRWVLTSIPKSAWIFIVTRDFQASKTNFISNILIFKGWLAA